VHRFDDTGPEELDVGAMLGGLRISIRGLEDAVKIDARAFAVEDPMGTKDPKSRSISSRESAEVISKAESGMMWRIRMPRFIS